MKETISIKLFNTLKRGRDKLGKDSFAQVKQFVESQRLDDGSFMDKCGKTDIYYTAFGWMLSYVLGIRIETRNVFSYLGKQDALSMDLIHYAAFMRCKMILALFEGGMVNLLLNASTKTPVRDLESFVRIPHADPLSPYTQFIWLSLLEDTRNPIQDKKTVLASLDSYQVKGGGFSNIKEDIGASANAMDEFHNSHNWRERPCIGATTNATTAALTVAGQLGGYKDNANVRYLWDAQTDSGGYGASQDSPLPDLLSTATALFVLKNYNKKPKFAVSDFIEAHWLENGGFAATLLEDCSDVEYTFYGLLALGNDEVGSGEIRNKK